MYFQIVWNEIWSLTCLDKNVDSMINDKRKMLLSCNITKTVLLPTDILDYLHLFHWKCSTFSTRGKCAQVSMIFGTFLLNDPVTLHLRPKELLVAKKKNVIPYAGERKTDPDRIHAIYKRSSVTNDSGTRVLNVQRYKINPFLSFKSRAILEQITHVFNF